MSYPDEPDYDDDRRRTGRGADERGRASQGRGRDGVDRDRDELGRDDGPRRATQPARPAWDAATYGTPDDLRRRPPARGGDYRRAEPPPPPPPVYRDEPSAYEPSRYPAEPAAWEPPPWEPPPYPDPPSYGSSGRGSARSEPAAAVAASDWPMSDSQPGDSHFGDSHFGDSSSSDSSSGDPYRADPYPSARYPGGIDDPDPTEDPHEPRPPRAGRNLPAAIGVGVGLGAVAAGSLFFWRPAFLGVLAVAVGVGVWELVRAIRVSGVNPPLIPLIAGGGLMTGLAWWGQADALTFGLMITVLAALVWRLGDGPDGYSRDVTSATLVAVYLPFLAGFAAMLASPPDGDLRVVVMLAGVVLSDTGGYIAGVLFGRHPMAPSVSPKKSWEGLAGSLVATALGSAVLLHFAFDVHWYWGLLFGVAVSAAAVIGDLGESMLKRDLGVKDMSNLLPGHGGLMDRLDSILLAAPTAYALLMVLAPVA